MTNSTQKIKSTRKLITISLFLGIVVWLFFGLFCTLLINDSQLLQGSLISDQIQSLAADDNTGISVAFFLAGIPFGLTTFAFTYWLLNSR